MTWPPEIDYKDLPNGRSITVCGPHKMVVCGRCGLDFSFDVENSYDDEDNEDDEGHFGLSDDEDEELFGFDFNSVVPRDVSFHEVAASKYGRRRQPAAPSGDEDEDMDVATPAWHNDDYFQDSPPMPPLIVMGPIIHVHGDNGIPDATFKRASRGNVFPTKFSKGVPTLPSATFIPSLASNVPYPAERFINLNEETEFLIYTDGACSHNGAAAARGGCSFIFKPPRANNPIGGVAFRLEERGFDGYYYKHTSNRAELRAVIAALRHRNWTEEGFRSLVIATDSTYVVNGATQWVRSWVRNDWQLSTGEPVKNRDLWEALLVEVEDYDDAGMAVRFWKIPRHLNDVADSAAKRAAAGC